MFEIDSCFGAILFRLIDSNRTAINELLPVHYCKSILIVIH